MSDLDEHLDRVIAERARVNPAAPEDFKTWWAERVANSPALRAVFSPTGQPMIRPFEPADYTDDRKKPSQIGAFK